MAGWVNIPREDAAFYAQLRTDCKALRKREKI